MAILGAVAVALWPGPRRATVAFIVVHVVVGFLAEWALAWRRATARCDGDGGKRLTFSRKVWFAFLASAAFASLLLYVELFIGSARADAAEQHFHLRCLIAGFASGALYFGWILWMDQVTWTEQEISRRTLTGKEISLRWNEVVQFRMTRYAQSLDFLASDGTTLRVHSHFDGVPELIADAQRLVPTAAKHRSQSSPAADA